MKDQSKTISERANRFLAVDMKDRLKSAFNRGSVPPASAPEAPRADDTPDYSSIFAHRAQSAPKRPPLSAPLDQPQLAEPTSSVTMRNPGRRIAHDIEEAEIVGRTSDDAGATSGWESVSLMTCKGESTPEERHTLTLHESEALTPEIEAATAANGSSAKASAPENGVGRPASVHHPVAVAKPVPVSDTRSIISEDARVALEERSARAAQPASSTRAAQPASSNGEDPVASKPKFRFFSDATESVRLKVDKRPDKQATPEPETQATPEKIATDAAQSSAEPAPAEGKAKEVAAPIGQPAALATPSRAERTESASSNTKAINEAAAIAPATSEQPALKTQKENASMDAKGQET